MARIRSVHPGLWTDEDFVSLSPVGRLLAIGLWTECDDQGVFPWKPASLKMRLLPMDNANIGELLDELIQAGAIRRYTVDGKDYGAVRNFRRWQKPERPKAVHPLPAEIADYVALATTTHPGSDKKAPPFGGPGKEESRHPEQEGAADQPPLNPCPASEASATDHRCAADPSPTDLRSDPDASPTDHRRVTDQSVIRHRKSGLMEDGIGREEYSPLYSPPPGKMPAPAEPASAGRTRGDRGERLPDRWAPDDADRTFATQCGVDPDLTAERFRDYWRAQPGAKGRKSDWPATWRNWCRREAEHNEHYSPVMAAAAPVRESRGARLRRELGLDARLDERFTPRPGPGGLLQ
jgi:hypothetical protein